MEFKKKSVKIHPYIFMGIRFKGNEYNILNNHIILKAIHKATGVIESDLIKHKRKAYLVDARKIYCHNVRKYLKWSFADIGKYLNNRNHASIIYCCNHYYSIYKTDNAFREKADMVTREIECNK